MDIGLRSTGLLVVMNKVKIHFHDRMEGDENELEFMGSYFINTSSDYWFVRDFCFGRIHLDQLSQHIPFRRGSGVNFK